MMVNTRRAIFFLVVLAITQLTTFQAWAVNPNPLENAYWRFEEGTVGQDVAPTNTDAVFDSANSNHMRAYEDPDDPNDPNDPVWYAAPVYTSEVPPTALKSGLPNTKALDFIPQPNGKDLHTSLKNINNPIINNGFTLEAAFRPFSIGRFQAIVGKDGKPNATRPEQTLALKIRGDTNELQIELFDDSNTIHGTRSAGPLAAGQWYYAAVTNDGTNLSLWLDRNDGNGYVLEGTDPNPLAGALWSGDAAQSSTDSSWTIGRGMYNSGAADWFDGVIDEVRLTNSVLSPSQFLFAPPGGLDGDHNEDGTVDAADYVLWRKNPADFGGPNGYDMWRSAFGNSEAGGGGGGVPEPTTVVFAILAVVLAAMFRSPRSC